MCTDRLLVAVYVHCMRPLLLLPHRWLQRLCVPIALWVLLDLLLRASSSTALHGDRHDPPWLWG